MYLPKHFAETDQEKLVAFMCEFNFATLVTAENDVPFATHLPFVIEQRNNKIYLQAHLAKANPHWQQFGEKEVLVIFTEPHAYISPLHYEKVENVPTWNYIAVHAYGNLKIFPQTDNLAILEKQVEIFDRKYFETNWQQISDEYKTNLSKGVIAFEIEVTVLEGKKKLNQNKTGKDAQNVIESLEKSENANERAIANYMKEVHHQ